MLNAFVTATVPASIATNTGFEVFPAHLHSDINIGQHSSRQQTDYPCGLFRRNIRHSNRRSGCQLWFLLTYSHFGYHDFSLHYDTTYQIRVFQPSLYNKNNIKTYLPLASRTTGVFAYCSTMTIATVIMSSSIPQWQVEPLDALLSGGLMTVYSLLLVFPFEMIASIFSHVESPSGC